MDLFRCRCYLASLQGSEPPNPKRLLGFASRPTKLAMGRLGIFSVSSFHALVQLQHSSHAHVLFCFFYISDSSFQHFFLQFPAIVLQPNQISLIQNHFSPVCTRSRLTGFSLSVPTQLGEWVSVVGCENEPRITFTHSMARNPCH